MHSSFIVALVLIPSHGCFNSLLLRYVHHIVSKCASLLFVAGPVAYSEFLELLKLPVAAKNDAMRAA